MRQLSQSEREGVKKIGRRGVGEALSLGHYRSLFMSLVCPKLKANLLKKPILSRFRKLFRGTNFALSIFSEGKLRMTKFFIASLLIFFGSFQLFAEGINEHLSCSDFEKILKFVQSEHLRFSVEKNGQLKTLLQKATEKVPEVLRFQGAYLLAAEFENYWPSKSKNQHTWLHLQNFCEALYLTSYREAVLKAFVSSLDPFSEFYASMEIDRRTSVVDGHFVGVGIGTRTKNEYLEVVEVVSGGPADGLIQVGDLISHIDQRPVRGMSHFDLRQRIRGPLHSEVMFKIIRNKLPMNVKLKRDHVYQKSMSYDWIEDSILHVKLHRFYAQTAPELKALVESNRKRLKGLILDLRDNPGGLLQAARDVVDLFVSQGVVVHLKGAYEDQMWALGTEDITDIPLVVLVNEKTASASEIVAGALQDYGRAIVVGQKTFGKSCVQNIYDTTTALGTVYKGGLKLTTLWFYLPSGRSVQSLMPDIQIASVDPTAERFEMPFDWPQRIDVIPFPKEEAKIRQNFEKFKNKFKGISESEEIGKAIIQQMAISHSDR